MIPKVIHYCWFGGKPLPKSAKKCIASWKKFMPDYEVKEWNESNFDVHVIPYTHDAYVNGNYVFVSDYARFWILHHEGGVYFDTDVEVVHDITSLVEHGAFMGWEQADILNQHHVNPGLGLSAPKDYSLFKEVLDRFEDIPFFFEGKRNPYGMMPLMTDLMTEKGLEMNGKLQVIENLTIYPWDYLCPMNSLTGKITLTKNSYSIHRYTMLWMSKRMQWRMKVMRVIRRFLGNSYCELRRYFGK